MLKKDIVFYHVCLTYKSPNNLAPYCLSDLFSSVSEYQTRNATSDTLHQPRCNNSLYKSFLSVNGSRLWNKLPLELEIRIHFLLLNITLEYIWLIIKPLLNYN